MNNFWIKLKKPFFVLAPMADVTDCAFRQIICKYGKPDVFWTEFVSADGLAHPDAREKLLIDLKFEKNEHPIVAQIFGSNADNIREATKLCAELGFDGVDINMGCPDKSIEKQGAGASCMKDPAHAREIIRAAKEGAPNLPISVKTRIGYNKNEIETWIPEILKEGVAVLTVHLRTRKEMSLVPAHWDLMPSVVALRDKIAPETLIIGNGDVLNLEDGKKKCFETGCDGAMLGRAIFGNPWLFQRTSPQPSPYKGEGELFPSVKEKLNVMVEHTKLFEELLGGHKNFAIMKKHYKAYCNDFRGAKELRVKLMEAENSSEVEATVNEFLKNN
ncbi:MAG: tRNA-dihydrouridine synthase [Candidatus Nomurabacteria bacterium]|nr:tRNA-dihydrouridine synthase [Candidatus Nomurabacteria bacterium]